MGKMIFEGKIDESEIGRLSAGMPMLMTVGAIGNNKIFNATLEYIAPKGIVENGTVQFLIRAAINIDRQFFLRANYSANADIIIEKKSNAFTLPESVLRFSGDSVYVEKKSKSGDYLRVPVKTGISDGINIEILSGVAKDDLIKGIEIQEGTNNE
jgi:HlyD family secretion protein